MWGGFFFLLTHLVFAKITFTGCIRQRTESKIPLSSCRGLTHGKFEVHCHILAEYIPSAKWALQHRHVKVVTVITLHGKQL